MTILFISLVKVAVEIESTSSICSVHHSGNRIMHRPSQFSGLNCSSCSSKARILWWIIQEQYGGQRDIYIHTRSQNTIWREIWRWWVSTDCRWHSAPSVVHNNDPCFTQLLVRPNKHGEVKSWSIEKAKSWRWVRANFMRRYYEPVIWKSYIQKNK